MFSMVKKSAFAFTILSLTMASMAWADYEYKLPSVDVTNMRESNRAVYDKIYPYYIETCSMTQFLPKEGGAGGKPGHAVVYVKGMCRDISQGYPRVKVCEPGKYTSEQEEMGLGFNDMTDPNSGMGFSANKQFKNVNWVGIPRKSLFMYGDISSSENFTNEKRDLIANKMLRLGTHDGMKLYTTPAGEKDLAKNAVYSGFGTDFAFGLARHSHCVRIPIERKMLYPIARYLNKKNEEYHKFENYHWDVVQNNCTHFVHNVLAVTGYFDSKKEGKAKKDLADLPERASNLAVPANRMISILERGNETALGDFSDIYDNAASRHSLFNYGWLPTQHGVLVDIYMAHSQKLNQVYNIPLPIQIFIVEKPKQRDVTTWETLQRAVALARDPMNADIQSNLENFISRYKAYLQTPLNFHFWNSRSFDDFKGMYQGQIKAQLGDAERKLSLIRQFSK